MDNSLRLHYLQAMGIDVWVPRQAPDNIAEQIPAPLLKTDFRPSEAQSENRRAALDWKTLRQTIANCQRCTLAGHRAQTTIGTGNQNANWLLITDEPDIDQEAMLLLSEMLRTLGLDQDDVWITSALKCPLPKERAPYKDELAECRLFLQQQIEWLQPKIILLLGPLAAQSLLQTDAPLIELRGAIHKFAAISTVVTYHPQFLLSALLEKRNAWLDLQLAMTAYREVNCL